MSEKRRRKPYKRIALALSLCAILISTLLGTGASLAWFADTSEEVENIFHFADFDVKVSHYLPERDVWEEIGANTKIFDEEALYEPGYVQVVYLKIENLGDRPFDFQTTVTPDSYVEGTNVFGDTFKLQDHLRFGLVYDDDFNALRGKVASRTLAEGIATERLGNYYANNGYSTGAAELDAEKSTYAALVVCMPEDVGNEANYRGDDVPQVHLTIIVSASQQQNP